MRIHKYAEVIPKATDAEYAQLVLDIKRNGLIHPVVTFNGEILDGRHRWNACKELDIAPKYIEYLGNDPLRYVLSANVKRRHLTDSQRAMISAKLSEESTVGGDRKSDHCRNSDNDLVSQSESSQLLGVSRDTTIKAKKVLDSGNEELIAAVDKGHVAVSDAVKVIDEPDDVIERAIESVASGKEKTITKAVKKEKRHESVAPPPMPDDGLYDIILADPPWKYDADMDHSRSIENHYPTMEIEEICDLQPPCAKDAALFLWATAPKMNEALRVMERWGFKYTTQAVWVKNHIGCGWWFRNRHELLLVGRRGGIKCPEPEYRVDSVIEEPRGEHSEKPERVYRIIENAYPNLRKLELFSRKPRAGWTAWGHNAESTG